MQRTALAMDDNFEHTHTHTITELGKYDPHGTQTTQTTQPHSIIGAAYQSGYAMM